MVVLQKVECVFAGLKKAGYELLSFLQCGSVFLIRIC
jgi:hypothetical protein